MTGACSLGRAAGAVGAAAGGAAAAGARLHLEPDGRAAGCPAACLRQRTPLPQLLSPAH